MFKEILLNESRDAIIYRKKNGYGKDKYIIVDKKTNTIVNDQEADTLVSKFFNTKEEAEKYWKSNSIGSDIKFNNADNRFIKV